MSDTSVDEIAPDVFRIATFVPEIGITFNQFLVRDEEPLLYHTGFRRMFPATREAVGRVLDPAKLRWVGFSHFEPDECGALNDWLGIAPNAQAIASTVGVNAMLNDFADRPAKVLENDETFSTGKRRFRFLSTPHLPHGWDSSLMFEETEKTLFCSDLFLQPGLTGALREDDIMGQVREVVKASVQGPFAHDLPYTPYTAAAMARLSALKPQTLAAMHGASYRGDGGKALSELAGVLRDVLGAPD